MLNLAIIILLLLSFFAGLRRGFILQAIHLISFVAAAFAAYMYYEDLAAKLKLWIPYPSFKADNTFSMLLHGSNMEEAYYRVIAFALIFFAVRILLHIIGSALDFVAQLPILRFINVWAGGILGFLESYLILFILLYIGATLPVDWIQSALNNSFIAQAMIKNTPFVSGQVEQWWLHNVG
ncbi:CvpA family protein [Heyndrickxia acidicola]|uniref:CvpA family protein n=1 Tax=Heyndrickxia acidicola TaxID=209389 RepID=A0ABU6MKI8_9BACI|nr:CvpA family protein [Heyndrickxia acidicola]MED1204858.1 CvpA family protein [Heyndrickxia acidicola]